MKILKMTLMTTILVNPFIANSEEFNIVCVDSDNKENYFYPGNLSVSGEWIKKYTEIFKEIYIVKTDRKSYVKALNKCNENNDYKKGIKYPQTYGQWPTYYFYLFGVSQDDDIFIMNGFYDDKLYKKDFTIKDTVAYLGCKKYNSVSTAIKIITGIWEKHESQIWVGDNPSDIYTFKISSDKYNDLKEFCN